uniref:Olfactory receptor n=1 Tax=Gallus gallus TaxID=9031 RepID=A0A8V0X4H7_CHICK
MPNSSSISEFLLLALADTRQLQLLHFWLLLGIYLAALLGNGLISTAVACDHRLHTPMYFFLLNLALLDLGCISTTLPKAMANALWGTRAISYTGCAAQVFFFLFFLSAEYSLLSIMSYDRYVAICKPLHYGTLLGSRACATMAAAAWGSGLLYSLLHTANTFSLPLCQGNAVDQFFCEIPQILKLSCSDAYLREAGLIMAGVLVFFGCFVFIVVSYVQIFRAVLRMPSEQGRHKAFSTCLPHLAVISLCQHCHICLPEAPLHLLPIPGPGGVISIHSGPSSCEPPHLQHEEPGAQGFPQEDTPTYPVSPSERCSSCSQDYKKFRKNLIDFMWCFCFFFMSVSHTYNIFNSN